MSDKGVELLMMFINDGYKSQTGKISRKTAIAMMRYVAHDELLQDAINSGDSKLILSHRPKD